MNSSSSKPRTDNSDFVEKINSMSMFYALPGGEVYKDLGPQFSFECGCGRSHLMSDCFGIVEFRNHDCVVMACPDDDTILTLVKCKKGILGVSCKGVESLSSYKGDLMDDVYMKFPAFQRMNHHGQSTLKEYFDGQKQGKF